MTNIYEWNGKTYVGMKRVARAAGLTVHAVSAHITRYGNLDRLGVGRGVTTANASPVEMAGHSWPSQAAMARDLGVWPDTVGRWLDEGRDDLVRKALARRSA